MKRLARRQSRGHTTVGIRDEPDIYREASVQSCGGACWRLVTLDTQCRMYAWTKACERAPFVFSSRMTLRRGDAKFAPYFKHGQNGRLSAKRATAGRLFRKQRNCAPTLCCLILEC